MNETTSRRGKYTLAGALVTAGILFYVFSLLTPAIVNSRDTSNGNTCRMNLSNLALGMILYEGRNGRYPGYMNVLERTDGSAFVDRETGRVAPVSWVVELLSDLDRGPLYENWKMTPVPYEAIEGADPKVSPFYATPRIDVYLEIVTCPGQDLGTRQNYTPLSYVVNTGMRDLPHAIAPNDGKPGTPRDWQSNGVIFDNYSDDARIQPDAAKRGPMIMTQHRIRDPKDKTILVAENLNATSYAFDSKQVPGGDLALAEMGWGCVWGPGEIRKSGQRYTMTPADGLNTPNADADPARPAASYADCRPSSSHPSGFNVAFAAKNVQFVSDKISYAIYAKLMASDDVNAKLPGSDNLLDSGFSSYTVNDEDLNP
jgi:hypothetical protein